MTTIKEQPPSKRHYNFIIIYFFSVGIIFSTLGFMLMIKFPLYDKWILFKYLGFLFINYVFFRPLTLRYYLAFMNSAKAVKKPTFFKIFKAMSAGDKACVSLGCLIWLFILVLWLFPIPETISEAFKGFSAMGLATILASVFLYFSLKLRKVF